MAINKTIVIGISLSNRSCPYEFNSSIDFCLKTTSQVDVIAPSIVFNHPECLSATKSQLVCHYLMLCRIIRSQCMGECETRRRPTSISRAIYRLRRNRRSCINALGATHLKNKIQWNSNENTTFSFMKMQLKMSSMRRRQFCPGQGELMCLWTQKQSIHASKCRAGSVKVVSHECYGVSNLWRVDCLLLAKIS